MNKYLTLLFFHSILILVLVSCGKNNLPDNKDHKFELVRIIKLKVPEPSGLDLTFSKDGFWTVSDGKSTVYRLDSAGNILRSFKVKGIDLEGITVINENTIAVVLERTREVVLTDTLGKEMKRKKLDLKGDLNSGPEGITYDAVNEKFYIVNEKSPGLLIELDRNLNELSRTELKLAKDYSGIFYETKNKVLWILSDESKKILITDTAGKLTEEYNTTIEQAEGITLNYENDRLYIVSDVKEELYEYRIIRTK